MNPPLVSAAQIIDITDYEWLVRLYDANFQPLADVWMPDVEAGHLVDVLDDCSPTHILVPEHQVGVR